MSYDLFAQGPSVYVPVLIVSFIITIAAYCAFPLIFASIRKKQITSKKYRVMCYLVNILVMAAFIAIGGSSSGFPYFLWTTVFAALGKKMLSRKGLLQVDEAADVQESEPSEVVVDNARERESNKRGFKLPALRVFILVAKILVAAALVLCILRIWQDHDEISDLNRRITELESVQLSYNQTVEQLQDQIDERDAEIRLLNQAKNRMSDKISELESEIEFYDRYVVFVRDDNTGWYHKYDCMIFQNTHASFWAYNIDTAIAEGYDPCFYCFRE